MRPIWLIEADVYREATEPLNAEIRRQGMAWGVVTYDLLASGYFDRVGSHRLRQDDCVIFYGTWPTLRQIQLHWSWVPGGWCSAANLDCSSYYTYFRSYLLNCDHTILTGIEAIDRQAELFSTYGVD